MMNMMMSVEKKEGLFAGLKMSSREISRLTKKDHKHVKRDIDVLINQGAILESNFGLQPYKFVGPGGGLRTGEEYVLDFKATMILTTGYDAVRRAAVIDRWMELEEIVAAPPEPQFQIPQTLGEALRLAADLAEKIEKDAPKVEYAEAVMECDGSMSLTKTAKSLGVGRNKFIAYLRNIGLLYKDDTSNLPMQKYVDLGIFEVRTVVGFNGFLTTQTFVTGKGQEFLQKKLSERRAIVADI